MVPDVASRSSTGSGGWRRIQPGVASTCVCALRTTLCLNPRRCPPEVEVVDPGDPSSNISVLFRSLCLLRLRHCRYRRYAFALGIQYRSPVMPVLDARLIQAGVVEVGHELMKRSVDHTVLETLAVGEFLRMGEVKFRFALTCCSTAGTGIFGVGGFIYWINHRSFIPQNQPPQGSIKPNVEEK
ncbi:hypothetical protein CH63R_11282 [Colletotrichum higginsianum IMI 349063]|uniref:Uncharacterized protein n=1 Tax=Colletotrichum higginsianum (strain IMI 349063) TaxID=759273 RepID=A0A1B7XXU6_COLHI|nr:hypothetical protein CH63R_11282 [Colletotrichum higginsianum IMI 349063]OBR04579.1 hypothetical protein CH63R_11282 [Colletotrichum higginsianum IMI 349063]